MNRTALIGASIRVALICAGVVLALAPLVKAADIAVLTNGFTIQHDHHVVMGSTTRLFLSTDDSSFTDVATDEIVGFEKELVLPTSPKPTASPQGTQPSVRTHSAADVNQVVNSASAAYHLDPDLVNSVIHAESGFNSRAVSPKGAQGLMQLMPSTATALGVNDAFDPKANVTGGSQYLRELLERYNFDLVKALAAYNAGPQRVEQYNGVPPFHETRAYVARIVHDYNKKKIAQERAAAKAQKQNKLQKTSTASAMPARGNAGKPKRVAASGAKAAAKAAVVNSPR